MTHTARHGSGWTAAAVAGLLLITLVLTPQHAQAAGNVPPRWQPLAQRLVDEGISNELVMALFSRSDVIYKSEYMGKKIRALYRIKYDKHKPPARAQERPGRRDKRTIYDVHLTPDRLAAIRLFCVEYQGALQHVEKQYGTPPELVMAILVVETRLGEYLGVQSAFNALASMAAARSLDDIGGFVPDSLTLEQKKYLTERMDDKSDWALKQLKALIRFATTNKLDPVSMPGSIYGAIGLCQFMPATALECGVDGDGDGRVDLYDPADAVHSVGFFLKRAGWKSGLSQKKRVKVIRRYNNDEFYARTVLRIATRL